MAARSRLLGPLIGVATALLLGCVQEDGRRFNPLRELTEISADDERELGRKFDREILRHVEVIDDPIVAGLINDLGQSIVRQIEPQPFIYRFRVINDDELNAFAVPGGYIYFNSGTLLSAGSIDELAGVMGHEIAHVKARHFARLKKRSQIPSILTNLAGMAVAVATEEPGVVIAAQAANVAMQLRYTREFESEADKLGAIFVTRAGYEPAAITRFLERILVEQARRPSYVPPYLFSHPEVEDRIAAVEIQAEGLRRTGAASQVDPEALYEAQARVAYLIDSRRSMRPAPIAEVDRSRTDPPLAEANRLAAQGETDRALLVLARAESLEPADPRVPYRIGELLSEAGRPDEATVAYRRTLRLDPSRAMVFYKLGMAYKAMGDRHRAVYALEQAVARSGSPSALRERAEWQVTQLTFTLLPEVGLADAGARREPSDWYGISEAEFPQGVTEIAWWARVSERFAHLEEKITVRWLDPNGAVVQEGVAEHRDSPYVAATLKLDSQGAGGAGEWIVEALYEGDVIDHQRFVVRP